MSRHMAWSQPKPWAKTMGWVPRPKVRTLLRAMTDARLMASAGAGLGRSLFEWHRRRGFPALLAVLGHDGREDAAAHEEARREAHEARPGRRHQLVEDLVGDRLVEL